MVDDIAMSLDFYTHATYRNGRQFAPLFSLKLQKRGDQQRTTLLPRFRSPRGAFLTPCKSPKILDFTGFSGVSLLVNSRPKPANFSWFFAFLLAGY